MIHHNLAILITQIEAYRILKRNRMSTHLTLESRPEPKGPPTAVPLPEDNHWIHRVDVGGHALVAFRRLGAMMIGFAPGNGWTTAEAAHYPVEEIYKAVRDSRPSPDIPADTCFEAIRMLQAACNEEKK